MNAFEKKLKGVMKQRVSYPISYWAEMPTGAVLGVHALRGLLIGCSCRFVLCNASLVEIFA